MRLEERYMVSPEGYDEWFKPGELPEGWTDCTGWPDHAINRLMRDRWNAEQKRRREEEDEYRIDLAREAAYYG